MYFSIGIVIIALLAVFLFARKRRRQAIKKVCSMTSIEKCELLNSLIEPFGYCYDKCQDIISSRNDAWQREIGYTALFDRAAAHFHMVFDHLPVYFPYQGRTWLIELWKGQYGINTGGEVGIYYAGSLLTEKELPTAHFDAVTDRDMLPVTMKLLKNGNTLANISRKTWWLTGFCMGLFSQPGQLCLEVSIHFPDCEMLRSFTQALCREGFPKQALRTCGTVAYLHYGGVQNRKYSFCQRISRKWAQFTNRLFCRVYLRITGCFCLTVDRLLYLYYLLPRAFRRMLSPRRFGRHKCKCRKKR
ncbi:hypothetical protein IMSAGC019_02136 [Lachnospiraceae bacterium]|nr:hypothetical protein IMSAGC019_02136 [Lachnospiraceae bacterium]